MNTDDIEEDPIQIIPILLESFLISKIEPSDMVVLTSTNKQLRYLNKLSPRSKVEIRTTSRSQGIDKECVILVLPPSERSTTDWTPLKNGISRARSKLLLVGSLQSVQDKLADIMEINEWIVNVPYDAIDTGTRHVRALVNKDESKTAGSKMRKNEAIVKRIGPVIDDILANHKGS